MEAKKPGNAPESTQIPALPPLKSKEDAAAAVKEYAHALLSLALLTAARDKAISDLQTEHENGLRGREGIRALSGRVTAIKGQIEEWARENRREFGEAKSLELSHGILWFQMGKRKLVLRAKQTWAKVLEALQSYPATSMWREFIRNTPEVNKQKLLDETKDGGRLPEARLREIGLKVDRDESFDIETKPEAIARDCDITP